MEKATFTVGVFGAACRKDPNVNLRIKVNVRTDQQRQLELAGLPVDAKVKIVDLPGGAVAMTDASDSGNDALLQALRREVLEETCCTLAVLGDASAPLLAVTNTDPAKPMGDLAFVVPIRLFGTPRPTDEAADHIWISRREFESEDVYRCPGKLGKRGRMGRMLQAAFQWFEEREHNPECFSV